MRLSFILLIYANTPSDLAAPCSSLPLSNVRCPMSNVQCPLSRSSVRLHPAPEPSLALALSTSTPRSRHATCASIAVP